MLMNNLDQEVAERPSDLVVYGGTGKAARNHASLDVIVRELRDLANDETLLVQSGKAVARFRTFEHAPKDGVRHILGRIAAGRAITMDLLDPF